MSYLAVLIGGLVGGVLRYLVAVSIPAINSFPVSTLTINLAGSFILGLFYGFADARQVSSWLRMGFGTGVIGAFTTFSMFCLDTSQLESSHMWLAVVFVVVSIVVGPTLAYVGERVAGTAVFRTTNNAGDMSA